MPSRPGRARSERAGGAGAVVRLAILGAAAWLTMEAHAQAPVPQAGPPAAREAAAPAPPRLSTAALLGRAVDDGKLDAETALVYEVFAAFGDPRLPAIFRGGDAGRVEVGRVASRVAGRYQSLSPAARAAVGPFLMPPYHVGSWWDLRRRGAIRADAVSPDQPPSAAAGPVSESGGESAAPVGVPQGPCIPWAPSPDRLCAVSAAWEFLDADVPVRIWWQRQYPEDRIKAEQLRYELEHRIWSALVNLMGRAPLDDWAMPYNGGDGRVDVALLDEFDSHAAAFAYHACPTPGFVLVDRTGVLASGTTLTLAAAVAHEFMHLIQYAFGVAGACHEGEYDWLAEATATWAEDYVYPAGNTEHRVAASYVTDTWLPLEHPGYIGSRISRIYGSSAGDRRYGAYVFFFYLARQHGPELIRAIWENAQRHGSLEAIDRAVPGGLAGVWPRFAALTWNQDRIDHYRRWDQFQAAPGTAGHELSDVVEVVLDGHGDRWWPGKPARAHAAINYQRFRFTDDSVRTIAFYNGWTFKLTKKDYPTTGTVFETEPIAGEERRGLAVQALLKIGGQWDAEPRDWTDIQVAAFCRDVKAERVEELILIWSNARLSDPESGELTEPGEISTLWVSNMGCWRWQGTVSHVDGGSQIHSHWGGEVTFERVQQMGPHITYRQVAGQVGWHYDKTSEDCRYGGSGTAGPLRDLDLGWSYNYVIAGAQHRKVALVAVPDGVGTFTRLCRDGSHTTGMSGFMAIQTTGAGDQGEVSPDGTTVVGRYEHPGTGNVDEWRLEAQRE